MQKGWTFKPGEGCVYVMHGPYGDGDCPWRWKVERGRFRYCRIHDPRRKRRRRR